MPKTFKTTEKRYIDDVLYREGDIFTTSFFDDPKRKIPDTLIQIGGKVDKAEASDQVKSADAVEADLDLDEMDLETLKVNAKAYGVRNYHRMGEAKLKDAIMAALEAGVEPEWPEENSVLTDTGTAEGTGMSVNVDSESDVNPI